PFNVDADGNHVSGKDCVERSDCGFDAGLAVGLALGLLSLIENYFEALKDLGDVAAGFARRKFFDGAKADLTLGQATLIGMAKSGANIVLDQTTGASQLADGVEVARERHPRVGKVVVFVEQLLSRSHKGDIDANHRCRIAAAKSANAEIAASWILS